MKHNFLQSGIKVGSFHWNWPGILGSQLNWMISDLLLWDISMRTPSKCRWCLIAILVWYVDSNPGPKPPKWTKFWRLKCSANTAMLGLEFTTASLAVLISDGLLFRSSCWYGLTPSEWQLYLPLWKCSLFRSPSWKGRLFSQVGHTSSRDPF